MYVRRKVKRDDYTQMYSYEVRTESTFSHHRIILEFARIKLKMTVTIAVELQEYLSIHSKYFPSLCLI